MPVTQNELNELMPEVIRKGVAAAILAAQDAGLVAFPIPLVSFSDANERLEGVVEAFVALVKKLDPTQLKD